MFPDLRHPKSYVGLGVLALAFLAPLALNTPFWTNLFVLLFVFSALSIAWNIVGGFAGQLSLGHAVFYGIGGYTSTLLTQNFGISPWIGLFAGAAISGAVAVVISYPTLRLKGPFFALATIAILEVVRLLVIHEESWTGGSSGISLPLSIGWKWMIFRDKTNYLVIAFGLFLFVFWVSWMIRKSRLGHYLLAIRERESAAQAVGVNTAGKKTQAAVISAMLTSIVGTFHITYLMFVDPASAFSLELSIQIAMFSLIGGMGTLAGPVAGTFLVLPIAELARAWLSGVGNGVHGLIYGIILVIVVLTIPQGLVGSLGGRVNRLMDRLPYLGRRPAARPRAAQAKTGRVRQENPVLEARHLFKNFGGLRATNDVSLTLHENEILGIIGPNGAGKTTVFNLLSGFIRPDKGTIRLKSRAGHWVSCGAPYHYARQGLSRTFQTALPFTSLTVLENIMLGAFMNTADRAEAEAVALEIAELTDLRELLDVEARNLTVGGVKRLEVARALASRPTILLLDEVMAGLNPTDIERAIAMIRRVRESGVSVVMIEHMMQAVMALSDRIVVISEGAVLTSGSPREVVENPQVIEAYLGREQRHA
ncbi:Branched-chain amino acid transport ATP-binding protein LivG [Castellaniella defragrans 65Phen]|uniref:Branched-chain amino acid transport ATP-binding protein LivG n=1 Tax=Castellaniella defragrans (strain DSM 12143 / CCUG 39792 / 65Phen) TaxID=1437824 RepID=W8X8W9_CASD6|nr:branched-chain amino acid ABC transporter ATP-binding protein/permease [Castellaniella defragrans]CDM23805.1 Branched-chain amino acid transport ATP-binding protein LivG [Castellaniella defragrans 65Phen]